jgi:tetratricopeptide (TPR) repeat protein
MGSTEEERRNELETLAAAFAPAMAQGEAAGELPEAVRSRLLVGLLVFALVVRVIYAWDLPLNSDEANHLTAAATLSLNPWAFHLPLGSTVTNHPLAVLYSTALARWLGDGSILAIRLAFVGLSMIGLWGLFVLAREMFGIRAALAALALAAADRHLVSLAPQFLESPAMLFLVPWTILAMRRCLVRGRSRDWLTTGLLFGLGYWISMTFLVFLLPFGLYIVLAGRLRRALACPALYAGVGVMLLAMTPHLAWNMLHELPNYGRNMSKVWPLGLSPRLVLVYLGDLMIYFRSPMWLLENTGDVMYLPYYIPCHWMVGLAYLIAAAVSLRFWRDERTGLLLAVIVGLLIPVSLLNSRESWNEITWASSTVFAAILLAAAILDRLSARTVGRLVAAAVGIVTMATTLWFLTGAKWGYFCYDWERAYVGQALAVFARSEADEARYPNQAAKAEVRRLTDALAARHGETAATWFCRGLCGENAEQEIEAFRRALELAPNNVLVAERLAMEMLAAGEPSTAQAILEPLLARMPGTFSAYQALAAAYYQQGDTPAAINSLLHAAALKPEGYETYEFLTLAYDNLGREDEAVKAMKAYAALYPSGPMAAYVALMGTFCERGKPDRARALLERLLRAEPNRADYQFLMATLLSTELNDSDRAIEYFRAAARLGSKDPLMHYSFARTLEKKQQFDQAVEEYRQAVALDPDFADAYQRLGLLLSRLGRTGEAQAHLEAARRLAKGGRALSPPRKK